MRRILIRIDGLRHFVGEVLMHITVLYNLSPRFALAVAREKLVSKVLFMPGERHPP